jgi:hypothetical protein
MSSDLEVDTHGLRVWAAALRRAAGRVRLDPLPPVPGPPCSSTLSGTEAADAAGRLLTRLAEDLDAIGRAAEATADDYEDADERAAARLRSSR